MLASPSDGERFQIGSDVAGCMREDSVDSQFDQAACDNGPYLSCYRAGGSSRATSACHPNEVNEAACTSAPRLCDAFAACSSTRLVRVLRESRSSGGVPWSERHTPAVDYGLKD
eukprot:3273903-Prymnesium_polylepis.1